jgi:two-component system invasion response regulator UvrY
LAGRSHPDTAHRALHAGASGFVTKNCALADLIRAFRRVLAGGNYIGEQPRTPSSDPIAHSKLSKREYAVLLAIAAGRRTTDIASELNLDVRTISTYRRRVLDKMKMQTNAELIRYAAEHGL